MAARRRWTFRRSSARLERRLTLATTGRGMGQEARCSAPLVVGGPASTLALAGDLARLMDDMVTRGVGWDALDGLVPDQLDQYWQHSLEFLQIARKAWPAHLEEIEQDRAGGAARSADRGGSRAPDRASRRPGDRGRFDRLDAGDREISPGRRRSAARRGGVAGTRYRSRRRRLAIDRRRQGRAGQIHHAAGIEPSAICDARAAGQASASSAATSKSSATPAPQGREVLASEAMRPSNATAQWHRRLAEPEIAAKISGGMTNLAVIEAANPEMEALAIAVAMREARHLGKSAALVTPDRALARRVMAALGRWNLDFDDSGGDALMDTPAGIFARLAAEAAANGLEPPTLLALLKHPLCRLGGRRRRVQGRRRDARTGAAARHAAAGGKRRPCAGFRALSRRACQARGAARLRRCIAAEPRTKLEDEELDRAQSADRSVADGACAAGKSLMRQSRTISPNWRNAIARC